MTIGQENETLEFKSSTGERKEALESIVAILNKHCRGTLFFGVDDNGFVIGQQVSDSTKKDIATIINDLIDPKITPSIETPVVDGKTIIKVSFYGNNRPYSVNGKYLIRVGTQNRKMSTEELKRLIKNEDYSSKWEEEITDKTLDDIDDAALIDFYNSAKRCGRLEMDEFNKEKFETYTKGFQVICNDIRKIYNCMVFFFFFNIQFHLGTKVPHISTPED